MKVTYNWLKDFVDIKISARELAFKLTMAGLEVKAVEEKGGDFVFEIEITSNRPDWLSVAGIAREVSAITGEKLKKSQATGHPPIRQAGRPQQKKKTAGEKFGIEIEDKKDCPLYTARIIRGVKVGASPRWLKDRLESVGSRSVNNVVDITNYVLFELGEPLHAFDLDKLSPGPIIVRRARESETLVSIDGETRKLDSGNLVIADALKPVAVAGVMGGKDTEVTGATKNILLEAAIFNPVMVRRSRQKLGMNSDASYRFERGVDPLSPETASLRAAGLIQELCGGDIAAEKSSGNIARRQLSINFPVGDIKRCLGVDIPASRIKNILQDLGMVVKPKDAKNLTVNVPSWRLDVKAGIDLVEEVARVYGYENIPSTLASVILKSQKDRSPDYVGLVKDMLTGLGLNEVITYSLIDRKSLEGFGETKDALIEISNPLSLEQEVMRPLLMASLAQRVAYNLRLQSPFIRIFEIAKTYKLEAGKVKERYCLGVALCGAESRWFGPKLGHVHDSPGFLHLKGIIEILLERLGIEPAKYRFTNNCEARVLVKNEDAGVLKKLSGQVLGSLDIKHKEVFCAEIYLEEKIFPLISLQRKFNAAGVARYPGVTRDITLPVKNEVTFEQISAAIHEFKESLLVSAGFQDCYEGEKAPQGTKRMTVSLRYGSPERTLTEEEINPIHSRLVQALESKFQIKIS
jgi:phenylalanyl-tRNA synthetase beta chain